MTLRRADLDSDGRRGWSGGRGREAGRDGGVEGVDGGRALIAQPRTAGTQGEAGRNVPRGTKPRPSGRPLFPRGRLSRCSRPRCARHAPN